MYIVLVSFLITSLHMYMYMLYIYNNFILMRMLFVCLFVLNHFWWVREL